MRRIAITAVAALLLVSVGCSGMSQQDKGVVIGATSGAVIGGVIGEASGNTALGAILGAAIGGAAGGIIGNYMDRQAAEMERDLEGARIERVGEGIKITFDSGILFDVDKADLRPVAQENLGKLAVILNKYEDTNVLIEGHTDSDGSDAHNQRLSESRASSVAAYLGQHEVAAPRMITVGYGEVQPIADNATAAGKQQNRRVEVAVMANDKLKDAAQKQAGEG